MRRALVRAVDVAGTVRRAIGRLAIPAHGIIPPGLLGYSASSPGSGSVSAGSADSSVEATVSRDMVELAADVHPVFFGEFSAFFQEMSESFRQAGFRIRPMNKTMAEYIHFQRTGEGDVNIGRWVADYPDADNFVHTLLHSDSGFLGRYVGSAEIDALAESGRAETDPRIRQSIYRRAEELIAREALLLPLFHDQVYCFARPEVEGLESVSQGNPIVNYEELSIRR
jgi:ABC-type oligopeptide transport system substrate-binding subunit